MPRLHWIVNLRTKEYVPTTSESFNGEWKENYPHTTGENWDDVHAASLWHWDMVGRIHYTYDLCCDGGMFALWVDCERDSDEDIRKAKAELRHNHDVVSLRTMKLTQRPA